MSTGRILIADDEQDIRELLQDYLSSEGYECILAADAYEALEKYNREGPIDLVMSDIRMPGMNGIELLSEIKRLDDEVIVIMISAVKDIESAIAAMSKGAYDYISKPFKLRQVAVVAEKGMEKRRLLIENRQYQKHLEKMVEERTGELKIALEELDHTYNFTLRALVEALDVRDNETKGHSVRVVRYSVKLAQAMGIDDPQKLKMIEYGALLHDIGKIGIPDAILRKPGELSPPEWEVMKQHPVIAYSILSKIKFLKEPSLIVLHHHEHFNGGGYPNGLQGEAIPLGARIFHIADMLDAVTSDRPYCKARSFKAAAEEVRRMSGSLFDPDVVKGFQKIDIKWFASERARIDAKIRETPDYF